MNPIRYVQAEWSPWLIAVLVLCAAIVAVALWARRRERLDRWGPGLLGVQQTAGYSPTDLRGAVVVAPVADPEDRWLLGLAAPFVEQAGLLHERWSLVPAFCDGEWRRRLVAITGGWGTVRARDWRHRVEAVEQQLRALPSPGVSPDASSARGGAVRTSGPIDMSGAIRTSGAFGGPDGSPGSPDLRPWLVANLAMLLRLGVAARHTSAPRARRRLADAAAPLRAGYGDWLGYGAAVVAAAEGLQPGRTTDLRADLRTLYAPDGPWHETTWPR